ncbi:proteophosphoglycan ppg4 [Rhodotorula toruloides]|uniref:Proteophosphoglycan ppg4 n=1 Tax=Rhodotorula toruloides TaxID=5286 RepID=A0A511K7N0_RHOTO|nr:proteophosphoglycan ppg4 [Rhodotorula toruloides]
MDDSPWGAPEDSFTSSLPRPPSPPFDPSATLSLPLPSAPTWADDDAPGWGASADDSPIAVLPTQSAQLPSVDTRDVPMKVEERISEGTGFAGTNGGWCIDSPEIPRLSTLSTFRGAAVNDSTADLPPFPPLSSPAAVFTSPSLLTGEGGEDENKDEGGGWGGALQDLPPITSLRIASPPSPKAEERDSGWGVESEDADPSEIPPPLPTVDEVFASARRRRESVELAKQAEAGEDAWGSSQGWEERMRIEAELREKERLAELAAAGIEPEAQKPSENADVAKQDGDGHPERPAANGGITSIFRSFRKGAEDAAAKSTEVVKDTSDSAARGIAAIGRTTSARTSQDERRGDSPARTSEERTAGKSWWGRSGAKKEEEAKKPEPKEEDDPNTIGVEEVEQGESGRVDSPEPQQGAIGRFLSRLKRPASAPTEGTSDARQTPSPRNSSEQQAPAFRPDDFDALANGEIGRVTLQVQRKQEEEEATPRGGLFGLHSKSAAAVPSTPPEDDFGGLIGALANAPARPAARNSASKTFDPFDPLSDSFGALPARSALLRPGQSAANPLAPPPQPSAISQPAVQPPSHNRRTSSIASFPASPPLAPAPYANEPEDSFDDFFNSVVASTLKPASPPAVKVVAPTPRQDKPASTLLSSAASHPVRASSIKSPPPRMSISPPIRTSTASPASVNGASRATTPIMPLAPPPPPSQPLASTRGHVLSPPPAATQRVGTPLQAAPLAPSPASSAGPKSPPPAPPQRSKSGPLSLDDLSFFES